MSQKTKAGKAKTKKTKKSKLLSQLHSIEKRANRSQDAFEYEDAVESYTEALKLAKANPGLIDVESEYELLARRVACYRRLGDSVSGPKDLRAMVRLAKQTEDVKREVDALNLLVEFATNRAEFTKAERHAKSALRLSRKIEDQKREAESLLYIGDIWRNSGDTAKSMEMLGKSLRLYRELDDRGGEAAVLRRIGRNQVVLGELAEAQASLRRAIDITRSLGDRYEEAFALAVLSLSYSDMADQRTYGEQSLEIFSAIHDRTGQSMLYNNLGLMYGHLGLYGTAKDYTVHAVEMAREMRIDLFTTTYLESLGRAELDHGDHEQARLTMQEGLELSLKIEHDLNEAYFRLGLGRIALDANELKLALASIQRSSDLFREIGTPAELSVALAWLGITYLTLDDWKAAHEHTSNAVAQMEALGDVSSDYPPQEVWWLHYQVLKATPDEGATKTNATLDVSQLTDTYAWMVLQRARQIALTGIATLSDEGLRRNYLNKVKVNRELIAEWVRGAEARDLDLELESAHVGNLQDQLKRMLAIGARMNERRDLDGLLDFIMDQLIELSGAERVLLADISEEGVRQAVAVRGYSDDEAKTALDAISSVFDTVSERLNPVLLQDVSAADPKASEPENILDSLSVLGLPLISQGQFTGLIYLDNHTIYGPFNQSDVDLLSAFANQAASAIENARLYQDLEQRVADRTAELEAANLEMEQRAAELQIINSVQEGLASKLDLQAIYELIGDRIGEIFNADTTLIGLHDRANSEIYAPYYKDKGVLWSDTRRPYGQGLAEVVIESGLPLKLDTSREQDELGVFKIASPDSDRDLNESIIGVPIFSDGKAVGITSVQSYKPAAFDENDVRLLQTLTNSMSAALENIRLFDETQHLLQETEERAAELEIISSVEQALASKLEIQEVFDLVGDKIRDVFDAQTLVIMSYDLETDMLAYPYMIERGERHYPEPNKSGGFAAKILKTREVLMINQDLEKHAKEVGSQVIAGELPKSFLGVPLIIGDEANGVISLQNIDREDAFDDADLRLLTTLASSMSVALENVRLFDETRRRAAEMAALAEIAREVSATLDLTAVLEQIGGRSMELLNARTVNLRLLDADERTLKTVVALGHHAEQYAAQDLRLGEGISGTVGQTGKSELIADTRDSKRTVHVPGTPEDEPETFMVVPLTVGDEIIGTMGVWRAFDEGSFSNDDLDLLISLSRQAAIAIQNARLFHEVDRQKEYSQSLVINSPVAIVTIDEADSIVSWNPEAEELFGYTGDEAVGQNIDELLVPDDMRDESVGLNRQSEEEGAVQVTTKRRRKDGSLVDVELHGVTLFEEGKAAGNIAIYHDISVLIEAQRAAETANEAKSAFLATMSHEIRTPMNAIIGMTSLLLDTGLTDEQLEFTEIVRDSSDSLLTIINDILDFSKIEAGRFELESQPFDLRECIEGALDLIAPKASEKRLDLAYEYAEGTPEAIHGDVTRLRQIFVNLLNNAVKFTDMGEVVLEVEPNDGQTNELQFCIRDTGIGIQPEQMDRLFQSFSQVDISTSRKYGGTGLGLAISKRLSELMGGTMWVESSPGEGSTFHFTIAAKPAPAPKRAYSEAELPELVGKKVLIVDDNATNRKILTRQLSSWEMSYKDTKSPAEALKWLAGDENFDSAILDMHMPEMDGVELAIQIRKTAAGKGIPLLMLTSLGGREEVRAEERVEFAAFLTKPIKPSQLFNALSRVFMADAEPSKPEPAAPVLDPQMADRLPLRILLAEDNVINQKVAMRILARLGYRADVAGNGLEAIDALERQPYDVVLMDMQMPELDGLEATRRIRKQIANERQPRIIATTANAMEGDRELCLEAGMDDYVSKPLRVDELVRALSESQQLEEI